MELRPNRLGISHLMLWMASTSAVLAVGQWDLSTARLPENLVAEARIRTLIWSLGFGPLHGMAIAGVLIFLWRRFWSQVPFPTEPGHWILIVCGAREVVYLTARVSYLLTGREESTIWTSDFSSSAIRGFPILLAVIGAYSGRSGRIWNLSILAIGLLGGMTIFHNIAMDWPFLRPFLGGEVWMYLMQLGYSLPGILALVAVFSDRRHKQRRDLFHWCGVAIVVLGPIVELLRSFQR